MGGLTRRPSQAVIRRMRYTYTPQVVEELQKIEAEMGGRAELIGMLVLAPLNPDLEYVLGLLGDPINQEKSLAEICGMGNILPGDLLRHLSSAALLRGKILATQQISRGMAAVVQDIMHRSAPYEDICGTCLGTGTYTPEPTKEQPNPTPLPCESCRGSGVLLYRPDLDRQRLAMDLAQLLPKGGGIQIAQVNNAAPGEGRPGMATFDAVQRAMDHVLYGTGAGTGFDPPDTEPAEGEIVPPEEPGDV